MMTRLIFHTTALTAGALCLLAPRMTHANGRFPASVNVVFQPGNPDRVLLPVTFGLLLSDDGGQSFQWVCEEAVGYGGVFDPDYAVTAAGTMFAGTFDGLRVSRDSGCSWDLQAGALDQHVIAEIEVGADDAVWVGTSSGDRENDVFVSRDGGATFSPTNLIRPTASWDSLRVAPADPQRVYVAGFLPSATQPQVLLYRSTDGGASWVEQPVDAFEVGATPRLVIEAVAPDNADVVYARSARAVDGRGDILYRSTDGAVTWTELVPAGARFNEPITAVLARAGGEVFVGTRGAGVFRSTDAGDTWATTAVQPQMACLGERGDGELFACGANFAPDFFALGRSDDGQQWEEVVRFADVKSALACPQDTIQFQVCEVQLFPSQCEQFGCRDVAGDAGPGPGPGDDVTAPAGCCDAGADPRSGALSVLLTAIGLGLVLRRRARA